MNKSFVLVLLLAILAGGASAFMVNKYTQNQITRQVDAIRSDYEHIEVVVAARDLYPGDYISGQTVQVREVPKGFVSDDALTPKNWGTAKGLAILSPIGQGNVVLQAHLSGASGVKFSDNLSDSNAVTIDVDSLSSFSGMLNPTDVVDILMTTERDDEEITFPLLQDVDILATGVRTSYYEGEAQQFNTVTLKLDPIKAAKIIHAQKEGSLRFVLNGPKESEIAIPAVIRKNDLFGDQPAAKPVRIILGG